MPFEYTPSWHHQVSKFAVLARRASPRPLIALLGDSLTEGFSAGEFLPQYTFANRGISGDVSEAVLRRLEDSILRLRPEVVLLLIGTNDLALGYADDQIVANIREIVERIRTELPSTRVIVQSILPTRNDPTRRNDRIRGLNIELRNISVEPGAAFLDLHAQFADDAGELPERFSLDGLHLTGEGYALWAEALERLLRAQKI